MNYLYFLFGTVDFLILLLYIKVMNQQIQLTRHKAVLFVLTGTMYIGIVSNVMVEGGLRGPLTMLVSAVMAMSFFRVSLKRTLSVILLLFTAIVLGEIGSLFLIIRPLALESASDLQANNLIMVMVNLFVAAVRVAVIFAYYKLRKVEPDLRDIHSGTCRAHNK